MPAWLYGPLAKSSSNRFIDGLSASVSGAERLRYFTFTEGAMRVRCIILVTLSHAVLGSSPAHSQNFPLELLQKIHWGMKLDDVKKIRANGEVKREPGKQIYMVRDTLWGHPTAFGFTFSNGKDSLSMVSLIMLRKCPVNEFAELSDRLRSLLSSHHGEPESEKRILSQIAVKWHLTTGTILFLSTNDVISLIYSGRQ